MFGAVGIAVSFGGNAEFFMGATLGNALIYVFPALMFRRMVENMEDKVKQASLKNEVTFAMCTCYLGVIMGVIGAGMSIKSLSD